MRSTNNATFAKSGSNAPVSVIIPCYNCALTVERAVESVWDQTHRPAEVVLVNDASNDETAAVLERLTTRFDSWLTVINLAANSGPATARNTGWEQASQPFIAFLDADDSWHPRKIELQYAWMEAHPTIQLTGHGYKIYGSVVNETPVSVGIFQAIPVSFHQLLFSNLFSTPTVMLRRDLPIRFSADKRYAEDYLLWLSIAANHECCFFRQKLTNLHKPAYGASGLSADMWAMEKGELDTFISIYRQRHISLPMLLPLYLLSLLKYLVRLIINFMKGATP